MASRTATPSGVGGVKLRKPIVCPVANRSSRTAAMRNSRVAFIILSSFSSLFSDLPEHLSKNIQKQACHPEPQAKDLLRRTCVRTISKSPQYSSAFDVPPLPETVAEPILRPSVSEPVPALRDGSRRNDTGRTALCLIRLRCIELQEIVPSAGAIHCGSHDRAAGAVALKVPMFQIDSGRAALHGRKAHLNFAGFLDVGFVSPLVRDLPGHHEAARRLPYQNLAPVAVGSVDLFAIAAPAGPAFNDCLLHWRLADVVRARPPGIDPLGEHLEGAFRTCLHGYALANGCDRSLVNCTRHDFDFSLVGGCSTAFLNASRIWFQNCSKYSRNESNPSGLSWYSLRVPSARSITRLACLRMRRCCEIAGRLTGTSPASLPTGKGPSSNRARMARRVASPIASSCRACW